jgi:nicotinamidase/pyrazinamidase
MNLKALIIVDIQNDFCPGGALPVSRGNEIIPLVNGLSRKFATVVVTQDWHPANHVSFASNHEGMNPYDQLEINGINQVLWPDHCVEGTEGAMLHPHLNTDRANIIIRKGTTPGLDSYSAFFENDRITKTGLSGYLNSLEIEEVFLCGLATDYCVFYSAMDAMRAGFKTQVVLDACRGINVPEGSLESVIEEMKVHGIQVINSREIVNG